jgi:hypothetical protein
MNDTAKRLLLSCLTITVAGCLCLSGAAILGAVLLIK